MFLRIKPRSCFSFKMDVCTHMYIYNILKAMVVFVFQSGRVHKCICAYGCICKDIYVCILHMYKLVNQYIYISIIKMLNCVLFYLHYRGIQFRYECNSSTKLGCTKIIRPCFKTIWKPYSIFCIASINLLQLYCSIGMTHAIMNKTSRGNFDKILINGSLS